MERKVKADDVPSQANRLYIKLYCERKPVKNKKLFEEAKKSWKSLSLSEKKLFYKTSADKKLLIYADNLRKTETFLKEKKLRKLENELNKPNSIEDNSQTLESHSTSASINKSNIIENGSQPNQNNTEFINEAQRSNVIVANQEPDVDSPLCEPTNSNEINETTLEDALETQSNTDIYQDRAAIPLAEPAPPTVKIGKDLYEIIKGPGEKDWKDITKKEKNHYNSAVRAIKREYIKEYTKYLESLSQKQLFDHYMKTLH